MNAIGQGLLLEQMLCGWYGKLVAIIECCEANSWARL